MTVVSHEEKTRTDLEVTTGAVPPTKNSLVLWYHEADQDLLSQLDQYLQLLYRRLGGQIDRSYFGYPNSLPKAPIEPIDTSEYWVKTYEKDRVRYEEELKKYQSKHAAAVRALEHTVLFVPCISNCFLKDFWMDMERDCALRTLLENPDFQIMPIFVRPAETGIAAYSQPLCAYEGYHREVACQQIASLIEAALVNGNHCKPPVETPLMALFSSSKTIRATIPLPHDSPIELFRNALTPVQTLLEQTSSHVVESKQLAIAERSQRLALEDEIHREREALRASEAELHRRIEEMHQHLTAIEAKQRATLSAKIRRWFKPTK
jgi:hypothetical protein